MEPPQTPDNEKKRLEALKSLGILDTPAEESFDRITRLAQRMFDVPVALVTFLDSDRQWFKSCIGMEATEAPREISFCTHTILENDVVGWSVVSTTIVSVESVSCLSLEY